MNWEDPIVAAGQTDTGMRRVHNEDSYAIVQATNREQWLGRGHVFVVADGMGAHAVGELASKMACDSIPHNYAKVRKTPTAEALVRAYHEVGSLIHGKASANRDFQGMGTTCSTLVLLPTGVWIAHVGDSRIYRTRGGRIQQLTFDHSLIWELVRHKHLSAEQAQRAIPKNVITRSLGPDPAVEVDIEGPYPVEFGDVFVLCSDGLSGPVPEPDVGVLASNFHPDDACRYLINLANLRGGQDNITVIIVRIGPWVEPGTDQTTASPPTSPTNTGHRGFGLARVRSWFQSHAAQAETVDEHIYQSADCPIDEALLTRLSEEVRATQAFAIEHSWALDWSNLANQKRLVEEARSRNEFRLALRHLGDAITILGQAGRLHRKSHPPSDGPRDFPIGGDVLSRF